ncbi:hypothetical protein BCR43DRAFT_517633 [Syncephalastrum racemosum]|uniref:Zn(2)-C6 fungal-type domain-containing protein n=1 Tax=Syncephalastrum racemosum TaxID=13706 RepID=A0A1X2H4T8_SYNRA|nr:hypothetical protein BCR43DRAFT_517633 [Syncephalastrum racemosum]
MKATRNDFIKQEEEDEPIKRPRTSIACIRCHHKKVRCDGRRPTCSRCSSTTDGLCAYPTCRRSRNTQPTSVDPFIDDLSQLEARIRHIETDLDNLRKSQTKNDCTTHTSQQDLESTEQQVADSRSILARLRLVGEQRLKRRDVHKRKATTHYQRHTRSHHANSPPVKQSSHPLPQSSPLVSMATESTLRSTMPSTAALATDPASWQNMGHNHWATEPSALPFGSAYSCSIPTSTDNVQQHVYDPSLFVSNPCSNASSTSSTFNATTAPLYSDILASSFYFNDTFADPPAISASMMLSDIPSVVQQPPVLWH